MAQVTSLEVRSQLNYSPRNVASKGTEGLKHARTPQGEGFAGHFMVHRPTAGAGSEVTARVHQAQSCSLTPR